MAGRLIRGYSPCRIRGFLLLYLFVTCSVANGHDKKEVNWGQWGPCSGTCGAGQRSRSGCRRDKTPCPQGQKTTETEDCSAVFACSSTSFSIQESSPIAKTSNTVTSSVKMSLQPSSSMAMMTSQLKVSSTPLIQASSSKEMTPSVKMTTLAATSLIPASTAHISTLNSAEMTSPLVIAPSLSLLIFPSSTSMKTCSIRASTSTLVLKSSSREMASSVEITQQLSRLFPTSLVLKMTSSTPTMASSSVYENMLRPVDIYPAPSPLVIMSSAPNMMTSRPESSTQQLLTLNGEKMTSRLSSSFITSSAPKVVTSIPASSTPLLLTASSKEMTSQLSSLLVVSPTPIIKSSLVPELLSSSTKQIQRSSENVNYKQGGMTFLQGYFTVKKDSVLLNHVMRKIRTSSAMDCAMFCLRRPKCQSFNFDCTSEGSKQCNNVKSNNRLNCELNAAEHLAHAEDFIPREGYYYYHLR